MRRPAYPPEDVVDNDAAYQEWAADVESAWDERQQPTRAELDRGER